MDDVINDSSEYNFRPEELKTYRLMPIFSGIMVPFSIMLAIPSFTGHWYVRTEDNVTTEIRANSVLLDIALAFSMACAVLANVFLVIRFAERCVKQMTLAAIAFLTLHGQCSRLCSSLSMLYSLRRTLCRPHQHNNRHDFRCHSSIR
jgi:hypothetical protein